MKKILTLACLFAAFSASAQLLFRSEKYPNGLILTAQDSLSEKKNIFYLELSVGTVNAANDVDIYVGVVDIGEFRSWLLADASGTKSMKFNSEIDIFNYLHTQGWEFMSVVENTRTTALWARLLFDVTTVRTKMSYIFKRQKK